jgi:phosphoenolpyruvate phosphomutase
MIKEKIVYTAVCADYLHPGHINIIEKSRELGKLIVGVMTDEAIVSYKRVPELSFEQRKNMIENIKGIWKVVPQRSLDYTDNIRKYKPDIVTNGDDWKFGVQKETRQKVIDTLKEWGGEVIDIPYTKGISSTLIIEDSKHKGVTTEQRRARLKRLLSIKPLVRVLEAHSGLSAIVVERNDFDAIWESSLTDSCSKGKPDIELVDFTSRTQRIEEILEVTTKPIIVDLDTGGQTEHFTYMVRTLERLGVSAVIIEDKVFPKRNSLLENGKHVQDTIENVQEKIRKGKQALVTNDFMIIARIESLISDKTIEEAINRAKSYIEAGADAIMIHSKKKTPEQIIDFCKEYQKLEKRVPLVVVPTTYNTITEDELKNLGVNVVIYANHLLRSSYKAMNNVARKIAIARTSSVIDDECCSVEELFKLVNNEKNT